ncbi:MAG: response regulator transcription factor [Bacteroidota bacterium]|nr:response regulator transcription factor [Bacteroidota bacterium]
MTRTLKILFILLSAIAFVITCIWYIKGRSWDSLAGIFASFAALIASILKKSKEGELSPLVNQTVENHQTVHVHTFADIQPPVDLQANKNDLDTRKKLTNILFVDDDTKFKVVSILKTAGWMHTKAVKDIGNLDEEFVKDSHIIFVDIQGVGKLLQTRDEGLGLALNLKKKYPDKRIVIYSAQTEGDRFHEALRKADAFLPKNAEPYEFQQLVEQYSEELIK